MDYAQINQNQNPIPRYPKVGRPSGLGKYKILGIIVLLITLLGIPLALFLSRQEQDIRQRAAETTESNICSAGNTDTFIMIDRSRSMINPTSNSDNTRRIAYARQSANKFTNLMARETSNVIGVASFGYNGGVNQPFTNNYTAVRNAINNLAPDDKVGTCMECAVLAVNNAIKTRIQNGHTNKKYVVLMSDGMANIVKRADGTINPNIDRERGINQARQAILAGHNAHGTVYYTIGLGQENNSEGRAFLQDVAKQTGGKYFFAPTAAQLEAIYDQIAVTIGKGSISGGVFNDSSPASPLAGWDVVLKRLPAGTQVGKMTTGTNGAYSFTSLCNASYKVELTMKPSFTLKSPTNPNYFELSVAKGENHTGKNFIVSAAEPTKTPTPTTKPTATPTNKPSPTTKPSPTAGPSPTSSPTPTSEPTPTNKPTATSVPTMTIAPGGITLELNLFAHGIGAAGDNVLPRPVQCQRPLSSDRECLSNQEPLRPQRDITVEILDADDTLVTSITGMITYDADSGTFRGLVGVPDSVDDGTYTLKVQTPMYLKRQIPGIHTLKKGEDYTVPDASLVSSDVDNDNRLTVLDYNLIISCYTFPTQEPVCDPEEAEKVDVNDDGLNNEFDENLFRRDLSVQYGE